MFGRATLGALLVLTSATVSSASDWRALTIHCPEDAVVLVEGHHVKTGGSVRQVMFQSDVNRVWQVSIRTHEYGRKLTLHQAVIVRPRLSSYVVSFDYKLATIQEEAANEAARTPTDKPYYPSTSNNSDCKCHKDLDGNQRATRAALQLQGQLSLAVQDRDRARRQQKASARKIKELADQIRHILQKKTDSPMPADCGKDM